MKKESQKNGHPEVLFSAHSRNLEKWPNLLDILQCPTVSYMFNSFQKSLVYVVLHNVQL